MSLNLDSVPRVFHHFLWIESLICSKGLITVTNVFFHVTTFL